MDRLTQDMFMFASLLRIMGVPELSMDYEKFGVQIQLNPVREVIDQVRQKIVELLKRTNSTVQNQLVYIDGEVSGVLSAAYSYLFNNLVKFSRSELY